MRRSERRHERSSRSPAATCEEERVKMAALNIEVDTKIPHGSLILINRRAYQEFLAAYIEGEDLEAVARRLAAERQIAVLKNVAMPE